MDDCLRKDVGFTPGCRECWVQNVACDIRHCVFVCLRHIITGGGNNDGGGGGGGGGGGAVNGATNVSAEKGEGQASNNFIWGISP